MYEDYAYQMMNSITNNAVNSTYSSADAVVAGGIMGAIVSFLMTYAIIVFVIFILTIIANWVLFKKAGLQRWNSFLTIHYTVVLFKIAGISPWWVLGYLAAIIPVIGGLVVVGITIYAMINLAKAFGKGAGFTVGLILLNTIFIMILAFGSSEYQLNKTKEAEIVKE